MSGGLDVDTEALRNHAADVKAIAGDGIGDVLSTGGHELALMSHVFGAIPSPLVAPPMTALGLAAASTVAATSGLGFTLAGGVDGTAEMLERIEDALTTAMGGTPDSHGSGSSTLGYTGSLVSTGEAKPFDDVPVLGSAFSLVKTAADGEGGFDLAMDSVAYGLDVLNVVVNPAHFVFGAAAGFVIELIPPVEWFLDALVGDPQAISGCSETWLQMGARMQTAAGDFGSSVGTVMGGWHDAAAIGYTSVAGAYEGFVTATGALCTVTGMAVTASGLVCSTLRGIFIDMLAGLIARLVVEIAAALLAAGFTFGGSLAAVLAWSQAEVAFVAASMGMKLSKGMTRLSKIGTACGENTTTLRTAAKDIKTFSESLDGLSEALRGVTPELKALNEVVSGIADIHKAVGRIDSVGGPIWDPTEDPTA